MLRIKEIIDTHNRETTISTTDPTYIFARAVGNDNYYTLNNVMGVLKIAATDESVGTLLRGYGYQKSSNAWSAQSGDLTFRRNTSTTKIPSVVIRASQEAGNELFYALIVVFG